MVKVIKFDKHSGYLVVTNLPVKIADEIIVYTIDDFLIQVITKLNEYLLYHQEYIDKITPYEKMGFTEEAEPSKYANEEIKALLFKRNSLLSSITSLGSEFKGL